MPQGQDRMAAPSSTTIVRGSRLAIGIVLASFLFVAGANAWVAAAASGRAYDAVTDVPARDVAIVPGSPTSAGQVRASLQGRLEGALALYRARRVSAILVSGPNTDGNPEASAMTTWLQAQG